MGTVFQKVHGDFPRYGGKQDSGARYDLVIHPTYANSAFPVPNVTFPAGFHPWNADPDGKYFQYRCELIWKDSLYANVDLFEMDAENWGIRVEYVNCTDKMQNCLLNLFSAIEYPENNFVEVLAPDKCDRWNGLDYEQLRFQRPRPWERLSPDGQPPGRGRGVGIYRGERPGRDVLLSDGISSQPEISRRGSGRYDRFTADL